MNNTKEDVLHGSDNFFGKYQDYLSEFVYGGIDGSVTTFAVVAGSAGAELSASIVLILGFANLLADGFSMSVGSYLSSKSDLQNYQKHKKVEYWEVENMPEKEKEEIRDIYREKGFTGDLLEQAVKVITSDKNRWVNVMMKEELEMLPPGKAPLGMALVTFFSFVIVGFIPLMTYVYNYIGGNLGANTFIIATSLTFLAFVVIGFLKSYVTQSSKTKGILETLALGVCAALVAYFVGDVLKEIIV